MFETWDEIIAQSGDEPTGKQLRRQGSKMPINGFFVVHAIFSCHLETKRRITHYFVFRAQVVGCYTRCVVMKNDLPGFIFLMLVYQFIILFSSKRTVAVWQKKQDTICCEVLRVRISFVRFGSSWNIHTVDCYLLSGLYT